MNKYQLSMRTAHGVIGTFFAGFGEDFKLREINKKTDVLLKFRHTQYAPFGELNQLKSKVFLKLKKMACSARLLRNHLQARWLLYVHALQTTLQRRTKWR